MTNSTADKAMPSNAVFYEIVQGRPKLELAKEIWELRHDLERAMANHNADLSALPPSERIEQLERALAEEKEAHDASETVRLEYLKRAEDAEARLSASAAPGPMRRMLDTMRQLTESELDQWKESIKRAERDWSVTFPPGLNVLFYMAKVALEETTRRTESAAQDGHPERYCHRCHRPNVTWFAPSEIWNKAVRATGAEEILCPVCFVSLAEAAGFDKAAWEIAPEGFVRAEERRTGIRRLVYNKETKQIEVRDQDGTVFDSFDPPNELGDGGPESK